MKKQSRSLCSISLILLGILFGSPSPVTAGNMSDYVWQHRPLLLFSPSLTDSRLQQTMRHLQQHRCELDDRAMLIGMIVEQGQSRLGNQPVSREHATTLKNRYAIENDQFAVILIGKDGDEKYRLYEKPDLDAIFALIDGMPMRQNEMAQNPVDCRRQAQ